ncbi:hypothetical protein QYE76_005769 [Lolium multiflorum]|uniref:Uncharacterized protein n=1 Tax=Lolium multiflorum TaxID=4521 RepID=A0AAD8RVE1_LOLMU|nr:hypothetical protein QYE76_005769 [Lolium multiflorum]
MREAHWPALRIARSRDLSEVCGLGRPESPVYKAGVSGLEILNCFFCCGFSPPPPPAAALPRAPDPTRGYRAPDPTAAPSPPAPTSPRRPSPRAAPLPSPPPARRVPPRHAPAVSGDAPTCNYKIMDNEYSMGYYLTDGIYPEWATLVKSTKEKNGVPLTRKDAHLTKAQEAARKDIQRAFGVLQARFEGRGRDLRRTRQDVPSHRLGEVRALPPLQASFVLMFSYFGGRDMTVKVFDETRYRHHYHDDNAEEDDD